MARPWQRTAAELAGVVPALALVFLLAFTPHLKTPTEPIEATDVPHVGVAEAAAEYATGDRHGYPYPMHVDEYLHWAFITSIQRQERVVIDYPYSGTPADRDAFFSLRGAVHERGYQLLLAQVQDLTGLSWYYIFQLLPAAWLAFTAFGVYASLRPSRAAIPAAAFVALIPTTVRFMGPAFLVPIGFVLAWIPAAMILADPARRRISGAVLLFAVVGWAFFVHLIGGFAAVGILLLVLVAGAAKNWKQAVALLGIALLPLVWLARTFTADVQGELEKEESLPIDFTIFDGWGLYALYAWAIGTAVIVFAGPRERRPQVIAWTAFSVITLGMILGTVTFDWGKYATYARWHPPFFLAAAVPMGFLVARVGRLAADGLRRLGGPGNRRARVLAPPVRVGLAAALVLVITGPGVAGHVDEPYYLILTDQDWAAYTSAAQAPPEYQVFLTHPWKAPTLTALSGTDRNPHAVLLPGTPPNNGADYDMYARTGGSLEFFILNDITMVVTTGKPPFDEFIQLGPGVWGLEPEIAREIAAIRAQERGG